MVPTPPEPTDRLVLALALCIGLGAMGGGFQFLSQLEGAYRPADLARSESPESFIAFVSQGGPGPHDIAARMAAMPLLARYNLASALLIDPKLLGALGATRDARLKRLETLHAGMLLALKNQPSRAEIWLMAAKTRALIAGFDSEASAFALQSYQYSQDEPHLALARLTFLLPVHALVTPDIAEGMERDYRLVQFIFPRAAPVLRERYMDILGGL